MQPAEWLPPLRARYHSPASTCLARARAWAQRPLAPRRAASSALRGLRLVGAGVPDAAVPTVQHARPKSGHARYAALRKK